MDELVTVAAELTTTVQHPDHGLPVARSEAVEELREDLVVRGDDDAAVQRRVRVDVRFDACALRVAGIRCAPHLVEISGRAALSGERRRLDLDCDARLNHRLDVGAPQHLIQPLRHVQRGDEHSGTLPGGEHAGT